MTKDDNKIKRWILPRPVIRDEIVNCPINYILQKVLCRRGINLEEELAEFITPLDLPDPELHFSHLNKASKRIIYSCEKNEKIAICGDYDADGITSTVLLIELLTKLGANVISYIPSRQDEGYGLNVNMINDIYMKEISLVITVDNGISAFDAIKRSSELGIDLIITDHHKIPKNNLEYFALIHPENTPNQSPYKFLAGVGIAYMLARNICHKLNYNIELTTANVLFCIGTIADMAPLVGANRKWLKECLPKINNTSNIGIRNILKKLSLENSYISSADIGFKIAPIINAVGRISDPKKIIDLLTSSSETEIIKLTKECFAINKERKKITGLIATDAIKMAKIDYQNNRKFLVIANREWHPGIIGIVASRIVDEFNLPTAILSLAKDGLFRGSVRSNNQINVSQALNKCTDLLIAHGGHSAAAGFSVKEENIPKLTERLNDIAIREFENCNLIKSIKPDAHLSLNDINNDLYRQLQLIGPFGIMNKQPLFWTRKCVIRELYKLKGNHLKMILDDGTTLIEAIKWNCSLELNINDLIDIAYYIEINRWSNNTKLQLDIIDIKKYTKIIDLQLHKRNYKCQLTNDMKIQVTNSKGESINSDIRLCNNEKNKKNEFANKILSFAEIALGKTA